MPSSTNIWLLKLPSRALEALLSRACPLCQARAPLQTTVLLTAREGKRLRVQSSGPYGLKCRPQGSFLGARLGGGSGLIAAPLGAHQTPFMRPHPKVEPVPGVELPCQRLDVVLNGRHAALELHRYLSIL